MPLDKFVLILCVVFAAAAITVWIGVYLGAMLTMPVLATGLVPLALIAFVIWRVIQQRLGNAEDDHYDKIDK